jgi:ABC-type phosphate transport system substrate-binding protein
LFQIETNYPNSIMKFSLKKSGLLGALLLAGSLRALALDGVVVIANDGVAATTLTSAALKDIYTGNTKYWEGGQNITIAYVGDKTDAAIQQASGMDTSAFKTFWQRLAFSGRGQQPKKTDDAAALVALVASTKGAIAIVPADTALTGVKTIEVK